MQQGLTFLRENASSDWSPGRTPVRGLLDLSELVRKPRTDVLGYSQPSLAGLFLDLMSTQDLRPGLLSAVPAGLFHCRSGWTRLNAFAMQNRFFYSP